MQKPIIVAYLIRQRANTIIEGHNLLNDRIAYAVDAMYALADYVETGNCKTTSLSVITARVEGSDI